MCRVVQLVSVGGWYLFLHFDNWLNATDRTSVWLVWVTKSGLEKNWVLGESF